jgi:branched-chain amino acid transport system substrate-binding protein
MMTLYNQLAALGLNTKYQIFQAEDGAIPQFVMDEIGDKMLGTLQCLSYHYSVDNPVNRKYVAAFQAKFNRMPEAMDAYVYVAMQALLAGLEATGGDTDPATLYNAIIKLKLNTIEGSVSFVPEGQPISNHYIVQVQKVGGKFTQVVIDTIKEVKPVIYRGTNYTKFEAK